MSMTRYARIALLAATLAFCSNHALAQVAASPGGQPSAASALTLDFPGGTAADYIGALRKASPNANIVVLGDLARIRMAAVQLKNVDVHSALLVLDRLPQDQGSFIAKVNVENVASSQDVPDVFTVTADIRDRGNPPGVQQTTVISMADLLGENLKSSDALTAIQTALGLIASGGEPAQIKFHEETGLLICRGSPEQIENIEQVIRQLRERAGTLDMRAQSAKAEQQQAEAMHLAADRDSKARAENEALSRQLSEWQTRAQLMENAVEEARKEMSQLKDELRALAVERDQLRRDLADLQAKSKGPGV